ncbi:MAG: hypothetical protein V3U23_05420 [Kiloniellales bacterium]
MLQDLLTQDEIHAFICEGQLPAVVNAEPRLRDAQHLLKQSIPALAAATHVHTMDALVAEGQKVKQRGAAAAAVIEDDQVIAPYVVEGTFERGMDLPEVIWRVAPPRQNRMLERAPRLAEGSPGVPGFDQLGES